jgi:hypothetical protein
MWNRAHQPARSTAAPPVWLRAEQVDPWRRTVAALEGWHGAVLAEPVGSGKSWIALAVAQYFGGGVTIIGPAALAAQWHHTAVRAGVPVHWHSHERLSRGTVPYHDANFVIVDEAHRFRHLHTRRSAVLAPWLCGRRTLLLTATPIINRRTDLLALLQLLVADDALALDGVASLKSLELMPHPPRAVTRLVIRTHSERHPVPMHQSALPIDRVEQDRCRLASRMVSGLALSQDAGVRRLLATVLLDAAASSDAAWRAALQRYRSLLLQSRDAGGVSRAALRQFAGAALDQLVLWPLLGPLDMVDAPPQQDLARVESLLALPVPEESWKARVAAVVADGRPTICFTRHRATARALVHHLGDRTAWVTGAASGIGPHRIDRNDLLAAFGPARAQWNLMQRRPHCLVSTEVLAEGLDLQGASRVLHLDLPWHPARLAQRNGRVWRLGQTAATVEVVTRTPPAAIERTLGLRRTVRHKARLTDRWLGALSLGRSESTDLASGVWCALADANSGREGLALVVLRRAARHGVIALELRDGAWQLAEQVECEGFEAVAIQQLTPLQRSRCTRLAQRAVWRALEVAHPPSISRPRLISRLLVMARDARIRRDQQAITQLDHLLDAAGRHHPLGLERQLAALAEAEDPALLAARLSHLPPSDRPRPVTVLLVLFRSGETPLR